MSAGATPGPSGAPGRGGAVALVALLVIAVAGAVFVYRARTPDLALEVIALDESIVRGSEEAEATFFVRFDEADATIAIVGRKERTVRTLERDYDLTAEERIVCVWDGRRDGGGLARPGVYRLGVVLPSEGRDMIHPQEVEVLPGGVEPAADLEAQPTEPCMPVTQ